MIFSTNGLWELRQDVVCEVKAKMKRSLLHFILATETLGRCRVAHGICIWSCQLREAVRDCQESRTALSPKRRAPACRTSSATTRWWTVIELFVESYLSEGLSRTVLHCSHGNVDVGGSSCWRMATHQVGQSENSWLTSAGFSFLWFIAPCFHQSRAAMEQVRMQQPLFSFSN